MTIDPATIKLYGYTSADLPEGPARVPRVEAFIELTGAVPSKWTAAHQKIAGTHSGVWFDHCTPWDFFGAPLLMSEEYQIPDLHNLGLIGTVHIIVPQRHSIYRPDTITILHTLPKHRDALIEIQRKVGTP